MLPIAQIIRLSWTIYISKFKKFLPLVAILFVSSAASSLLDYYLSDILTLPRIPALIYSGLISAVFYLINLGALIFFIFYTDRFIDNKKAEFSLKDLRSVYLPALLISLLAGLITIGGFLLVIIPGILFMVWYAFAVYEAVLEKQKGWPAFQKSHDLSKGRFWPMCGRVILPNLFWGIIAYLVIAGVFNFLGLLLGQSVGGELGFGTVALTFIISALIAAFFAPLSIISLTIAYREAKK